MANHEDAAKPEIQPFVRIVLDIRDWNRPFVEGEARVIGFEVEAIAGTIRQLITKGTGRAIAIRDQDGDMILDVNPFVGELCGCVNTVACLSKLSFG